jgi:hypothetical protein
MRQLNEAVEKNGFTHKDTSVLVHGLCLSVCQSFVAKRGKTSLFETVAVEHVVGVERDEALTVGMGDVDASLLDAPQVEALSVDELHDEDAEEVVITEVFRDENLRETAQEFA